MSTELLSTAATIILLFLKGDQELKTSCLLPTVIISFSVSTVYLY